MLPSGAYRPRMASSSSASFAVVDEHLTDAALPRLAALGVDCSNANVCSLTNLDDTAMLPLASLKAPLVSAETLDDEPESTSASNLVDACRKIMSLEKQCKQLVEELKSERREREALQAELQRVQQDNQQATALLCKYADWFFNAMDPHLDAVATQNGSSFTPANHSSSHNLFGATVVRSSNTTTDLL